MAIQKLEIHNLRNLTNIVIQPQLGLNFIFGPNGSGKTSLLEGIHCLGRGKSFRTHKTNLLINDECSSFTVVGNIHQKGRNITIGMQRKAGHSYIRLGGQMVSRASELSEVLPIAVLDTGLHRLIEQGPEYRRRFLDWGVFHVKHGFSTIWNIFRRSLAQRNAALRAGWSRSSIAHWDHALINSAMGLDQARREYLTELIGFVKTGLKDFPEIAEIEIHYQQGWRQGSDYASYLQGQYASDRDRGFTQFGPHRADLRIRISGQDARDFLSHGQQKVLVANLILAQCRQISTQDTSAVILVDDLPAELDVNTRATLLKTLRDTQAQVFITATDSSFFELNNVNHELFHVEHGQILS